MVGLVSTVLFLGLLAGALGMVVRSVTTDVESITRRERAVATVVGTLLVLYGGIALEGYLPRVVPPLWALALSVVYFAHPELGTRFG